MDWTNSLEVELITGEREEDELVEQDDYSEGNNN